MLGTIVLICLQLAGSWWISRRLLEILPVFGLVKLAVVIVLVSLIVWVIGVLASEFIKDVAKPTTNVLMSCLFVSALVVGINVIPLFNEYVIPIRETYLPGIKLEHMPIIGAVVGYYLSK